MTSDKKIIAINIAAFGLMVTSYYYPVLRYFIFVPLLITCVLQLAGWFFLKQKFGKAGILQLVTAVFSTAAYAIGLFYPDKILYVCGALLIFMGITFLVGRTIKPEEEIQADDELR